MQNDLISRSALREKLVNLEPRGYAESFAGQAMLRELAAAPAIDAVSVVHARWVKAHGMMPPEYHHRKQCSMCGGWALQDYFGRERMSHYCPNCGAKMDGGAEG